MLRILRITFQLASIGILFYLLAHFFLKFDFAATKNDHLVASQKVQIDKTPQIDSLKLKAKELIDVNRQHFARESNEAVRNFWLIVIFILIQIPLAFIKIK